MQISKLIKERRIEKGISLQKLSDDLKVSISYMSRIESGERKLNENLIKKISKFLSIPEKDLQINLLKNDILKFNNRKFFNESIIDIYNVIQKEKKRDEKITGN
jgi:transcriptional regulator with XRE-family HTH domain